MNNVRVSLYHDFHIESFWGYNTLINLDGFIWRCSGGLVFTRNKTEVILLINYERHAASSYYIADIKFIINGFEYNFYYNTYIYNFKMIEDQEFLVDVCSLLSINKNVFYTILSEAENIISFISVVCYISKSGSFNIGELELQQISDILDNFKL